MPIAVSVQEALENRRANHYKQAIGKPFHRRLYMGSEPTRGGVVENEKLSMPQAYLVEQPANSMVAPHFHDTNQFQVFVHGHGAFGKQPLEGLMVHYAGAHTPYGPIVANEAGVHYLTLRNQWDSGAKIMPENRHKLRKVSRVHRLARDVDIPDTPLLQGIDTTDLVPLEEDGLGVRQFDIGPGLECTVAFEWEGSGAYVFVIGGAIEYEHVSYETHSLLYRGRDEVPLTVKAGSEGANVLLMQFPPEPPEA